MRMSTTTTAVCLGLYGREIRSYIVHARPPAFLVFASDMNVKSIIAHRKHHRSRRDYARVLFIFVRAFIINIVHVRAIMPACDNKQKRTAHQCPLLDAARGRGTCVTRGSRNTLLRMHSCKSRRVCKRALLALYIITNESECIKGHSLHTVMLSGNLR